MAEMLDCTEVPLNEGALAGSAKSQSHLIFRFDLGGITVFDRASLQALDEGICVISFVGEDGFRRDKSRERFGLCLEFIAFFLRKRVDAPG
jgi:hypothetical protein